MKLTELKITQDGLRRARSQAMENTLYALRVEFARRGLPDELFVATASVLVAKEMTGCALRPSEPGFLGRLAEGASRKFVHQVVEELCSRDPDGGPLLDYNVNSPDGSQIEIRNEMTPTGPVN